MDDLKRIAGLKTLAQMRAKYYGMIYYVIREGTAYSLVTTLPTHPEHYELLGTYYPTTEELR